VTGSTVEDCKFIGKKSTSNYENDLMMMRNVQFRSTFKHNSVYADDINALDFIIAFSSGQMDCTGSPCTNAY
jgi:hypothetical protein